MRRLALALALALAALLALVAASLWLAATPVNRQLSVRVRPQVRVVDVYGRELAGYLEHSGAPLREVARDCIIKASVSPSWMRVRLYGWVYNVSVTYKGRTKSFQVPSPYFPIHFKLPIDVTAKLSDGSTVHYSPDETRSWVLGAGDAGDGCYIWEIVRAAILGEVKEGGVWDPIADGMVLCPTERLDVEFNGTVTVEVCDEYRGRDLWPCSWETMKKYITYMLWSRIEYMTGKEVVELDWDFPDGDHGYIELEGRIDYRYYDHYADAWSDDKWAWLPLASIYVTTRSGETVAQVTIDYTPEYEVESSYMVSPLLLPRPTVHLDAAGLAVARAAATLAVAAYVGGLAAWRWRR